MTASNGEKAKPEDLLKYLEIATQFRNHEFNIQILRMAVFSGSLAVLLVCYAATLNKCNWCSAGIAFFGAALTVLWTLYYRASLYWTWFWEFRCRQVNDHVVAKLDLEVNIFERHPIGAHNKNQPAIIMRGKELKYKDVPYIIICAQALFCILWLMLGIVALA